MNWKELANDKKIFGNNNLTTYSMIMTIMKRELILKYMAKFIESNHANVLCHQTHCAVHLRPGLIIIYQVLLESLRNWCFHCWADKTGSVVPSLSVILPATEKLRSDFADDAELTIASASTAVETSVREYVFYVFFRFQKSMTFYVFLNDLSKKRKKSLAKI